MPEPGRSKSKRLFFTGCALPSVTPGSTIRIYDELRKHYRGTGVLMFCCGAPVKLLGMDEVFEQTRDQLLQRVEESGAEELVVACPGCTYTLREHVPELRTTTVWELLAEKLESPWRREGAEVAVHDSCRARHEPRIQRAIRQLLNDVGCEVEELEYSGALTRCCGAGGRIHPVDPDLSRRIARRRGEESPLPMITYCAECRMALADCGKDSIHLLDFLYADDWRKAARRKVRGNIARYANRLRCKSGFKRLRPLGAG
jgi:Fe-S oxidoreductase